MNINLLKKWWLSYGIAGIGILLSVFIWHLSFHDVKIYVDFLETFEPLLPWLALLLGISISLLVGMLIRVAQVAQQRALTLKKINKDLKKEIGERMDAEDTKQKLEVALLQGQKLQAIGTLAGGIAHDFNNLLYAIIGYAQMAREDVSTESLIYKNLGKVLEATARGQELISRILSFSRKQHHEFSRLNLKETIDAVLALLKPTIPAGVMIHFEADQHLFIFGNQTQLHQVLVNIINNAVDAMEEEGTIAMHLTRLKINDPFLKQFPAMQDKAYCKLEITDTGYGMDQATRERIFEPFFTTKEVGKGSGLGLSIVHSIIKEHQGEIVVKSQLGHGSTFVILLPEHTK